LVKALKDKPIKFIAISPHNTMAQVNAYVAETRLDMPVYPDPLGLMEKRYGMQISLKNIHQTRVVGPDGKVVGYQMTKDALDKVLESVKVEPKFSGYDTKLDNPIHAFEWGQYQLGMKLLAPYRKTSNKALAESANKLFDTIKKEGESWKEEADKLAESEPVKAYDLYQRILITFPGTDLAKSVVESMKKLGAKKEVSSELAARKLYGALSNSLGSMNPAQKPQAAKNAQEIGKKYLGTPTAEKADSLAKELGS